jgi:hypothetical protein
LTSSEVRKVKDNRVEAIAVSLVLIALVVASSILARISPLRIPIPFVQIFLGAAAAMRELAPGPGGENLHRDAAARVLASYRQRLAARSDLAELSDTDGRDIERELHLAAIRAERAEIYNAARSKRLPEELASRLIREVDLMESRFSSS